MPLHPLYNKVATYCSKAERCPQEVLRWLKAKAVTDADAEAILDQLMHERFIDSRRFVRAFTSDKLRFSGWGPYRIKAELLARSLPEALVNQEVENLMEELDYRAILDALIRKKLSHIDPTDAVALEKKVIHVAYRMGFSLSDIHTALQRIVTEGGDT